MKTVIGFITILISVALSCSHESLPLACVDPIGSENITINKLKNPYLTDYDFCCWNFCFLEDVTEIVNDTTHYYANGCFQFYKSPSSSDSIISKSFCSTCTKGELIDIGEVKCLGGVVLKPSTGYSTSVAPKLNHGYVFKFPDNTYGRFFIDSWEIAGGEVKSMNIVRQYPF